MNAGIGEDGRPEPDGLQDSPEEREHEGALRASATRYAQEDPQNPNSNS